jgi:RNA-directed DNA polymerase
MVIKDKANKSWILGQELTDLVESCGLKVNPKKTRLQTCHQKQLVTGLIVNEAVNLDRHYIRNLRAMIHAYNKYGDQAVEKFMNDYAGHAHRIVSPMNTFMSSLNGRLGFVAMVKGEDHPIVRKLRLKFEHACNRQAKLHSRPLPYSTVS